MELPNAKLAIVEQRKIIDYLLNPGHSENGGKAHFFTSLGYSVEQWLIMADALRAVALQGVVSGTSETIHGKKFVVDGVLAAPDGRTAQIRSIWIVDRGVAAPRLVTAYPNE
jgi:hypothetical protein